MATYDVKFYNRQSGWLAYQYEVDAVTPDLAETEARAELGSDESYYSAAVVEVTPEEEATEVGTPDGESEIEIGGAS